MLAPILLNLAPRSEPASLGGAIDGRRRKRGHFKRTTQVTAFDALRKYAPKPRERTARAAYRLGARRRVTAAATITAIP